MTVPVPDQLEYISDANGVTKDFPYPKRFLQKDEIVVTLRNADGVDTPQVLNTHYTIAGSLWPTGGTVSFVTAPQAPNKVVLYRMTQAKQTVGLANNQQNDAPSVELQLDRLTMGLQDRDTAINSVNTGMKATLVKGQAAQSAAEAARDIAAGYASDAVSQGNVPIYSTVEGMHAIEVPEGINAIRVNGRQSAGDGLGGLYVDTDMGSDDTFNSDDGRTWWFAPDVSTKRIQNEAVTLPKLGPDVHAILNKKPTARVSATSFNGFRYDLIEVKGRYSSDYIRQVANPSAGDSNVQQRIPIKELAFRANSPIAVNSQAFKNADGSSGWNNELLVPNGLCIADGVALADWTNSTSASRVDGVAMYPDGVMRPINRSTHSLTVLLSAGVKWAVSWGVVCVANGNVVPNLNNGFMGSNVSARTVYGQRSNGDFLIFLFEGVTGVSGPTCDDTAAIVGRYGCHTAFIVEGGGSTQAWWNSYYAHGSSDRDIFRTMPTALTIDAITENEYDSGWRPIVPSWGNTPTQPNFPAAAVRQTGALVTLGLNVNGFVAGGAVTLPHPRFYPDASTLVRGITSGAGALPFQYIMQGGVSMGILTMSKLSWATAADPTSVASTVQWLQRGG